LHLFVLMVGPAFGLAAANANATVAAAGDPLATATATPTASAPAGPEPLRNWFNDPYFQVRSGMRRCPTPKGPMGTEAEMRSESHSRTERGTSCWLAKKCSKQNSYLYDPDIAAAVRARFEASAALQDASLWVTVQRRIVWVEGCVAPGYAEGSLEHLLQGVADVELLVVNVTKTPRAKAPYRTLDR
jgi:hypothetical protein